MSKVSVPAKTTSLIMGLLLIWSVLAAIWGALTIWAINQLPHIKTTTFDEIITFSTFPSFAIPLLWVLWCIYRRRFALIGFTVLPPVLATLSVVSAVLFIGPFIFAMVAQD